MTKVRSALLYSEGGQGKSFVLATAPGPILIADTEGRSNLLPRPFSTWSIDQPVPTGLTEDSITVVSIGSLSEFKELMRILATPTAPWKTFGVDSFTVLVKIGEDEIISATAKDSRQEYKKLLKELEPLVIQLKYLAGRADLNMELVIFTAWQDADRATPYMVGAIKTSLNHLFDLIGQVTMTVVDGQLANRLAIMPGQGPMAKAPGDWLVKHVATNGVITNPNIKTLNEEN